MRAWLTNRFRLKVGVFMLPLLLPIGGAAVDADYKRPAAPSSHAWTPRPATATLPGEPVFTPAATNRPTLRSDLNPGPAGR
ncbi:MAG: hypothetical protein AAF916_02945 [Planctomycetota bacterium]